jgi:hypothetical protein
VSEAKSECVEHPSGRLFSMAELMRTTSDDPAMNTPRYAVERCAHARESALVLFTYLGERYVALIPKAGLFEWIGADNPEPPWEKGMRLLLAPDADRG